MKSPILVAGVAAAVVLASTQLTSASTITLNFETKLEQAVTQLDHAHDPQKALAHFETKLEHVPGVNVFIDNPAVKTEEFIGTDGQRDVFVFRTRGKRPSSHATNSGDEVASPQRRVMHGACEALTAMMAKTLVLSPVDGVGYRA